MLHDVNGIAGMACHFTELRKISHVNGSVTLILYILMVSIYIYVTDTEKGLEER